MLMKNNFQSKAVPRGTRTIWRYLSALILLLTLAIGNVWADTEYVLIDYSSTPAKTDNFINTTSLSAFSSSITFTEADESTTTLSHYVAATNKAVSGQTANDGHFVYDLKTTSADVKIYVYNKNSNDKNVYVSLLSECEQVNETVSVKTKKAQIITKSVTCTTGGTRIVISGNTSDVQFAQIIITEKGSAVKSFGEDGYTLDGKRVAVKDKSGSYDGAQIVSSSDVKYMNADICKPTVSSSVPSGYIKFTTPNNGKNVLLTIGHSSSKAVVVDELSELPATNAGYSQLATAVTETKAKLGPNKTYMIFSINSSPTINTLAFSIPKVTYNANGGSETMSATEWTVAANSFTAPSGKKFDKWNTQADGEGEDVTVGTEVDANTNLFAIWKDDVAEYTVTYKDGGTTLKSVNVAVGSAPDAYSPTKEFYTFAAWQKNAADYDPADLASDAAANDEITLTARWTAQYTSGTYEFTGNLTMGTDPQMTIANSSDGNNYEAGRIDNIYVSAQKIGYEATGDYGGWKLKTTNGTLRFLVENTCGIRVTIGEANPLRINYKEGGTAKSADIAKSTTSSIYKADANTLVTLTNFTANNKTVTLKKIEVLPLYTATRVDGKSDGAGSDPNVLETTLPTPTAVSGWTFTGWIANQDVKDGDETKTAETILPAGTYTLLANTTFTAQWMEVTGTYDITYVSAHGTAPDAENAASVVLAELSEEGWAHKGWTANADVTVDAATVEAGTLIANGKTAILSSDVTFTAVWKEIFTVTFNSKDGSAVAPIDVEDGATLAAAPEDPTKDNYVFLGWSETDGGDVVADITAIAISADKTFFAKWALDVQVSEIVFSNSFKGWIHDGQVEVFYMAGESAPTLVSYDGKNLKAEGAVVISGDKVIATGTDDSEKEYDLTMTAVSPLTTIGAQTFDGTEGYVKTRHAWTETKKWKMSKDGTDGRVARGETSMYIFLGAAESVTFDWGKQQKTNDVAVYVNGTFVKNIGKENNSAIPLTGGNNMVAFYSLQTSGDVWLNGLTTTPWVPVTAVTLKEGEAEISSKEIWASTNFTLTAVVTPDNASDKTITWTSSNEAVATVVGGVVTGVAANASPVTITATTVDGISATCAVTVTAAPEPSAAPVITAQPASTNYYEGATIAALEVVATGESLSYQWYLGADAIDGAIAATYQPTVSAIGTYVYHCVVTNTEAGKLPTSLASDNATITIAEDPSAIKLINKSTGAINTTNFITGVTANDNVHGENGAVFGSSSSNASVKGLSGLNKVVVYNATTTQTKIKLVLYNTNSAAQEVVLSTMAEGDVDPVGQAISVPSKELYSTGYITYNSTKNRTFYLHTKSTNVQISQIQVIESGEELAVAGKKDYSLNLNKGRVYAYASSAQTWEGLSMNLGSNYSPATTEYITFKDNALSFSVPNDVCLTITPARAGDKYYVTDVADGTDNATTTVAGTPNSFDLTGGVGKVWYIRSQGSNVQLTNIAFSAPRCAEPAFNALTNSDICSGDPYVALDGTATVADLGTPTYKWYAEGADESDPAAILGTDATYTPTADGKYYVIATNHKEGFADNEKKSDLVTVTTYASAEITTAPADVRQTVGENATLTVVATGKAPLSYQWYTCDENGDNAVLIAGAEEDTYTVNVTADFDQFYKVVVTSGCGEASAVAHVVEWRALPQLKVNASTTWDWVNAGENIKLTGSTAPKKNEECVMANVKVGSKMPTNDDTFNSQALLFYGENVRAVDGGRAYASVGYIKFTTTVAGKVTVEFSTNTDDKVRCVKINGVASETSDKKATVKTFSTVVPAGEVSLVGYEEETANAYIRISKIIFDATDVSDADYTRDVTEGRYGTICVPNGGIIVGADIFELAYYGATSQKFFFDEIASAEMEAGKPYLFFPHEGATQLGVYYTDSENKSGLTVNGFVGFIGADADDYTQVPANDNCYIISNNLYRQVQTGAVAYILSNRAYIDMTKVTNVEPAKAPGARRIGLGVQGKDQAQGFENIETGDAPMKVMINGTMYILRGEKVYDATGRLVK